MGRRQRSNAEGRGIYSGLPTHCRQIRTRAFASWLTIHNARLIHTMSEYEVLRYQLPGDIPAILYKKANGALTWTIRVAQDYRAFMAYRERVSRERA